MSLKSYEENALLCNMSFNSATSSGLSAYRGDLVIEEGDIADAQSRRTPPKSVVKQAVVLADGDALKMVVGAVATLNLLAQFDEKYAADLSPETELLFYVANIAKPIVTEIGSKFYRLIPYEDGAVWTMALDDLRLEKSDFKGQSAEDKVVTLFESLKDFKPGFSNVAFTEAETTLTREVAKEARGAV